MAAASAGRGAAFIAVAGYALLWIGSVGYLALSDADFMTPIFVMGIFGIALPLLAWMLTRGAHAPEIEVRRPSLESGAVVLYLVLYAVGFLGFGMSAARSALPAGPQQEVLVMALKLVAHVMAPALLLVMLGVRLTPLFQTGLTGRKFWRTLLVLGVIILGLLCVISPSVRDISDTNADIATLAWAAPASFLWIAVEAGLNEEFLYRAVLQTRLSAFFRSAWVGVFVTAILFGLAHAPGLFLRGGPGVDGWSTDPWQVIAHTIATLSPMGLLFGLIYARTKSLLLVVLLHAMVDVLPNMAEFIGTWT